MTQTKKTKKNVFKRFKSADLFNHLGLFEKLTRQAFAADFANLMH